MEHYAMNMDKEKDNYAKLIDLLKASKKDLCDNGGYDEIVIEDMYDCFIGAIEKLAELPKMHKEA